MWETITAICYKSGLGRFIIVSVLCSIFLGLTGCYWFEGYSPDRVMENHLRTRKDAFTTLVDMAEGDRTLARISPDFYKIGSNSSDPIYEPSSQLTLERWNIYRNLFSELELKQGIMRIPDYQEVILMIPDSAVRRIELESKGYAYSSINLEPLSDSLDNLENRKRSRERPITFKHLEGNWYLYCLFYD
jgi:hypothetical protein